MKTEVLPQEISQVFFELNSKLSNLDLRISLLDSLVRRALFQQIKNHEHKKFSINSKIISATIDLAQKHARAVSISEIIEYLATQGVQLGKTYRNKRTYLAANLSLELRKPDARIVRTARGFYDVRDLKKGGEEKRENEELKT